MESSHGGGSDAGGGLEANADAERAGSEYSGGSDTSFFKRMGKKKRPPVQPIDFDELFARYVQKLGIVIAFIYDGKK